MSNQSVANPHSGNNATLNNRSITTVTNKSVTNRPSGTNSTIDRRSTTTVTDKSVVKTSSGQNVVQYIITTRQRERSKFHRKMKTTD